MNRRRFFTWLGLAPIAVLSGCGFPPPKREYASGGIADQLPISRFGELPAPGEAFIPLADGRHIPVTMGAHTVHIQGNADDKTAALIAEKIKALHADIQRNFGSMQSNWRNRHGA